MNVEKSFCLIKPDATKRNLIGKIITHLENEGFKIIKIKSDILTKSKAEKFYNIHRGKDFFEGLVEYIVSGMVVGILLEREDAVEYLREIVGNTNPLKAKKGTIRNLYGETLRRNSIHASDSKKSFIYESKVFFEE